MTKSNSKRFEVVVEVPRWGFVKRGSNDQIDFVSPLPCLFNYGSIPKYVGADGDLLDALILGPRLPRRSTLVIRAHAAIGLRDRGLYDDKLICSARPLSAFDRAVVINFFRAYALFKRALNAIRGRRGPTACVGWRDIDDALSRATARNRFTPTGR